MYTRIDARAPRALDSFIQYPNVSQERNLGKTTAKRYQNYSKSTDISCMAMSSAPQICMCLDTWSPLKLQQHSLQDSKNVSCQKKMWLGITRHALSAKDVCIPCGSDTCCKRKT